MKQIGLTAALVLVVLMANGCGPFGTSMPGELSASGSGNGDAGGTWTKHIAIRHEPWRFQFAIDCAGARRPAGWGFDVTLEQMHQDRYFDAVPIDLGWSSGGGPASTTVRRTVGRTGEFWFIVRASSGCRWQVRAPSR